MIKKKKSKPILPKGDRIRKLIARYRPAIVPLDNAGSNRPIITAKQLEKLCSEFEKTSYAVDALEGIQVWIKASKRNRVSEKETMAHILGLIKITKGILNS